MAGRLPSLLVDTDVFIDYLNGAEGIRKILDSPAHVIYYSPVARKELLRKPNLSSSERDRIRVLLLKHRLIPVDEKIADRFSRLLAKYGHHGLRNADALVAATAWARTLPLLTSNIRHYRFIEEITVVDPAAL